MNPWTAIGWRSVWRGGQLSLGFRQSMEISKIKPFGLRNPSLSISPKGGVTEVQREEIISE